MNRTNFKVSKLYTISKLAQSSEFQCFFLQHLNFVIQILLDRFKMITIYIRIHFSGKNHEKNLVLLIQMLVGTKVLSFCLRVQRRRFHHTNDVWCAYSLVIMVISLILVFCSTSCKIGGGGVFLVGYVHFTVDSS